MKTTVTINLRAFPVKICDQRTGEELENTIIFTKDQLRAAQVVGESSKELISRAYGKAGFSVIEIGKADKREIELDLYKLYREVVNRGE